ncbi:MAG: Asp-tRNA(Asn)/Glu-tRNA(Gln) amidotransferase GatCAB subunit B, partial [Desulfosalsimonas sp.]
GALAEGGTVVQETRLWDAEKNRTVSMRGKEEAHDYRYFPDPDLVPLVIEKTWTEKVRSSLPELPDQRRRRFVSQYSLPDYDADVLTASRDLADYFEDCAGRIDNPKTASNWVMGELTGLLNTRGISIADCPVTAERLAGLIRLIEEGVISGKIAKSVFDEMAESGRDAKTIVEEKGLVQVSDESAIEKIVAKVIEDHPGEVEKYRAGKKKVFGFFVGQVMKETRGKANPQVVNTILKNRLDQA